MDAEALLKLDRERQEALQRAEQALRDAQAAAAAMETTQMPDWNQVING